jgi:cytochrome P450
MTTVQTSLPWDAANPFSFYAHRRREGPVVWDRIAQAWLVFSYPVAQRILADNIGWTSNPLANPNTRAALGVLGGEHLFAHSMLNTDGPTHQRLRGSVRAPFARNAINSLTMGVDAICAKLLRELPTNTSFDFMADFALPFPIAVASAWLDLNEDTAQLLREESPAISRLLNDFSDTKALDAAKGAFAALLFEMLPIAAERRKHPGEDLLSFVAADPTLDLDDVVFTAVLIAVAGHETTANLLGSAMIRLLAHRDSWDPDAVDARLVNELLRLDGPVQAVARTATRPHTVGGVDIEPRHTALVVIAAANRDPEIFDEPDAFRPRRTGPTPLSFGYGPHFCLGAGLARLEITTALRQTLSRAPRLAGTPTWRDTRAIRGPQTLPAVMNVPPS